MTDYVQLISHLRSGTLHGPYTHLLTYLPIYLLTYLLTEGTVEFDGKTRWIYQISSPVTVKELKMGNSEVCKNKRKSR